MGSVHTLSDRGLGSVLLDDLLGLAFPPKSSILTGKSRLRTPVTWASCLVRTDSTWSGAAAGECALVAAESEGLLVQAVEYCAARGAVAIVVAGRPGAHVVEQATRAGIPLIAVPEDVTLRSIERAMIASIVNRQAELDQRGVQIYRRLAELVAGDKGIGAIVVALHELTGRLSVLESEARVLRFHAGPLPQGIGRESLAAALAASPPELPPEARRRLVSTAPPVVSRVLERIAWVAFTSPVVVDEAIAGWISLAAPAGELSDVDHVAAGRAAAVSALEIAKQRAVTAAAGRRRSDFFSDLLVGSFVSEEASERRARALGYHLALPGVVLAWRLRRAARPGPESDAPGKSDAPGIGVVEQLVEDELAHFGGRYLVRSTEDQVLALYPLKERNVEPARIWAQRVRARSPLRDRLAVGIGRAAARVRDLQRSFQEAEQALEIASALWIGDPVVAYDDLGVYRLLVPMRHSRELELFYADTIGPLLEYERRRKARLLPTLRALLNQNGNVSRTAEVLGIHRNTLTQRIERIEAITALNLADPDARLALHLGLKIAAMLDK